MTNTKRIAALILLATIFVATAPSLTTISAYIQNPETKAENYVELADKTQEQVQALIDLTRANATALDKIEQAGLMDELEGNESLFSQGVGNLTLAYNALEAGDYQGAVANATNAFKIFRQVFVALHAILSEAGVSQGGLVDAQGLIEAMERAFERIEKLRQMNLTVEVQAKLSNAAAYLNIETARTWLQEGRVNEVVGNLTQAKRLINEACKLLKEQAREMLMTRMRNCLNGLEKARERIMERLRFAENQGVNVTEMLEQMGYQNMEQFQQRLQAMIDEAEQNMGQIKNAIQSMNSIGEILREIDHGLTRHMQQHQGNGNGQGNNDNGNNGNGNHDGNDNGNNGNGNGGNP
jgi:tetratricopeptide (TPR) repeat protein